MASTSDVLGFDRLDLVLARAYINDDRVLDPIEFKSLDGLTLPMQFTSEDDVASYVEREIAEALPTGWSSVRETQIPLVWQIKPDSPKSAPLEDYRLRVTGDWKLFVLDHGNSDVGGFNLYKVLLNAKVIDADALDHFPLSKAIDDVITNCKPNEWGWT